MICIEVVYALREEQLVRSMQVKASCSVAEAVRQSAVLNEFPDINPGSLSYAVFGVRAQASQALRHGDRVEILRPLEVDPREARRRRAALGAKKA